jgi:sorting nexin-29
LEQGDALSPLLLNFALEYAIRRVQVNRDGTTLNGTHQLLVYAYQVNSLGGSVYTIKTDTLVVVFEKTGLEVNAHKIMYTVMSRIQNAGRNHNIKNDNSSFEGLDEFKYLGTTLTNQNYLQEEIRGRLKSGNACYHSVQNLLSSRLLSKNVKIKNTEQ